MEKKLAILSVLILIFNITSAVYADTLYDLYSDHGSPTTSNINTPQYTYTKHQKKKKDSSNNNQTSTSTNNQNNGAKSVYKAVNNNQGTIIQQGSQNYSANGYAAARKLTNPINIENPYSNINSHHKGTTSDNDAATSGNVTFKKDIWGNINEYDSKGEKIGTYKTTK